MFLVGIAIALMVRVTTAREASPEMDIAFDIRSRIRLISSRGEVAMLVRRESRLEIVDTDGVLRVWRDVVGRRTRAGEYVVISSEPGIKGEHLTIHLAGAATGPVPVRVVSSRPAIIDGALRHELRLRPLGGEVAGPVEDGRDGDQEAE